MVEEAEVAMRPKRPVDDCPVRGPARHSAAGPASPADRTRPAAALLAHGLQPCAVHSCAASRARSGQPKGPTVDLGRLGERSSDLLIAWLFSGCEVHALNERRSAQELVRVALEDAVGGPGLG